MACLFRPSCFNVVCKKLYAHRVVYVGHAVTLQRPVACTTEALHAANPAKASCGGVRGMLNFPRLSFMAGVEPLQNSIFITSEPLQLIGVLSAPASYRMYV
jgi:hypothetical protein